MIVPYYFKSHSELDRTRVTWFDKLTEITTRLVEAAKEYSQAKRDDSVERCVIARGKSNRVNSELSP